jgi:hypothetical protein
VLAPVLWTWGNWRWHLACYLSHPIFLLLSCWRTCGAAHCFSVCYCTSYNAKMAHVGLLLLLYQRPYYTEPCGLIGATFMGCVRPQGPGRPFGGPPKKTVSTKRPSADFLGNARALPKMARAPQDHFYALYPSCALNKGIFFLL